jgi:hypothetical protein
MNCYLQDPEFAITQLAQTTMRYEMKNKCCSG